jgi:predicted transposase YbfD/YdcC
MVSAFAARQRIVLGQVKANEKSNEIVAIPALLDMMSIEGAVVTIDAMGCQRDIASKIIGKKADYILALKGNQGKLCEDVEVFVDEQKAFKYKDTTISTHETVDADHGRVETRNYTVIHGVGWTGTVRLAGPEGRRGGREPANFATCRHIAYNLMQKAPRKDSIRLRRKTAGWDDDYLASLVAA